MTSAILKQASKQAERGYNYVAPGFVMFRIMSICTCASIQQFSAWTEALFCFENVSRRIIA